MRACSAPVPAWARRTHVTELRFPPWTWQAEQPNRQPASYAVSQPVDRRNIGTFHHLYFTGTPTAILALGATFSALEVVPLVLIGFEAYENLTLTRARPWVAAYKWPIYFFVGVAFWNLVGAGLFGFLINPPIALYYMQGLNTTSVHGHTALFGVYGLLGIGLLRRPFQGNRLHAVPAHPRSVAMILHKDRETIRELAAKWMEFAALPVMQERKRAWKAVHDLQAYRPVILFETGWVEGFVSDAELACQDPFLRTVERNMRVTLRQAEQLGDDIVIEPYYQLGWRMLLSDYGVPIEVRSAQCKEESMAYSFSFPIQSFEDIGRLRPRTFAVDREKTLRMRHTLEEVMGDVLPVRVGNYDPFAYEFDVGEFGDLGFTGNFFFGLTWQLYRFIGNQRLLYWAYDAPDAIHRLMTYLLEDRIALFDFFEKEGLLSSNTDSQMAGPRSYGYVSDLPSPGSSVDVKLNHLWAWAESQEFEMISPAMYQEFVLPYLAKLSERFGLVYYGCCERVDDRLEGIIRAIPNLRSVSISAWSDLRRSAEILGKRFVYSRKPKPAYISGSEPQWDLLEKDIRDTYAAAKDCNLEILFRDVYTISGDLPRLSRWVAMTKSIFQM